jgi:hypothetical protein
MIFKIGAGFIARCRKPIGLADGDKPRPCKKKTAGLKKHPIIIK